MNDSACEALDGYLGRWLSEAEHAAFAAHLDGCPRCRQAVQEQERLDQFLREATTHLGPVPVALTRRIVTGIRAARRRRIVARVAGLAAAVLLAVGLAAWWLTRPTPPEPNPAPPVVEAPAPLPSPEVPAPKAVVEVTVSPRSGVSAIPLKSGHPDVTILWLQPAVKAPSEAAGETIPPS